MRKCEYCGAELEDDALFCTMCGGRYIDRQAQTVTNSKNEKSNSKNEKSNSKFGIIAFVISLAALLTLLISLVCYITTLFPPLLIIMFIPISLLRCIRLLLAVIGIILSIIGLVKKEKKPTFTIVALVISVLCLFI